jgi:hypothetical protein
MIPIKLASGDTLEKGRSYILLATQNATIHVNAEVNEFETVSINGFGFVGVPSASTNLSNMIANLDQKMVYRYNGTTNAFEPVFSDTLMHPGDALFVLSNGIFEVRT